MANTKNRREFLQTAGLSAGLLAAVHPLPAAETTAQGQATPSMGARLHQLLREPGPIQAPSVYDAASARLAEINGFKAVFCGSSSIAQSAFALPDDGILSMTDYVDYFSRMTASIGIPVIADVDDFGGNALNASRNTKLFERAGLGAVMFDDRVLSDRIRKRSDVLSKSEMVDSIRAAVDARSNLVIIVNCYSMAAKETMDQAIDRVQAYGEAGADVLNISGLSKAEDWRKAIGRLKKPMITAVTGGGADNEMRNVGLKIQIYERPLDIALGALQRMFEELKATGLINESSKGSLSREMRLKITRDQEFDALRMKYNQSA